MYNVKLYTDFTQKMIWEPLNCCSFLDKIYLRLPENVFEITMTLLDGNKFIIFLSVTLFGRHIG